MWWIPPQDLDRRASEGQLTEHHIHQSLPKLENVAIELQLKLIIWVDQHVIWRQKASLNEARSIGGQNVFPQNLAHKENAQQQRKKKKGTTYFNNSYCYGRSRSSRTYNSSDLNVVSKSDCTLTNNSQKQWQNNLSVHYKELSGSKSSSFSWAMQPVCVEYQAKEQWTER